VVWPCTPETGEPMCFLFQIRLQGSLRAPQTIMYVFHTIDYFDEEHLIPAYSSGEFSRSEPNAETATAQQHHLKILFQRIGDNTRTLDGPADIQKQYITKHMTDHEFGARGAEPIWILEPETPLPYLGVHAFSFALQLHEDTKFKKSATARPQKYISYRDNGKIIDKVSDHYEFFALNAVYFFVAEMDRGPLGLVTVQS